ncbi:MAG: exodeoxyribonuclease VII large subunit [Ignavibacteria bacterium]|jgi:exodeoxyribonuclease VII large subunit|nr:exodeoxyribonuclease VII large subunit [Ignavibacteria bacterium]
MSEKNILTVGGLTKIIKEILEESFPSFSLIGEISNFKSHYSGHWYFTLKDSDAQISCTMWKGYNNYVFFKPEDGMKVIITGKLTVYPPRGSYQIDIRSMKPAGEGELQAAFERLKRKLFEEGLFDEVYKKEIPSSPKKIGVVTSIDGAAFKDIISVAQRRYPLVELVIAPAKVQGAGAAESIVNSIKQLNLHKDIEVIIVGRGGGSIEDLWAFNEEIVARAIFNSKIPIISAVGHEVDFTISDFVADLRAATPTAAMELATPDVNDIYMTIESFIDNSFETLLEKIDFANESLVNVIDSYGFRQPLDNVRRKSQQIDNAVYRIENNLERRLIDYKSSLQLLTSKIDSHNIEKTLKKGFVLVTQQNKFVLRGEKFVAGDSFRLKFFDKEIEVN